MSDWKYVAARSIGTSHVQSNLPCQDFVASTVINDIEGKPVIIAVASDGAGSAELSQIGSEMACNLIVDEISKFLASNLVSSITREISIDWLEYIKKCIAETAEAAEKRPRDYACTLLVSVVGLHNAVFFQVGDGAIVVSDNGEERWNWIFWPQKGEFANTTNFLIEDNIAEKIDFDFVQRPVDEFAVFTDGIESLVLDYAEKGVFQPFFDKMFPAVRKSMIAGLDTSLSQSLEQYLSSPTVCERTDDDKSLIMATRWAEPQLSE